MAVLVPEHGLPVDRHRQLGAIGSDHVSETDSQIALTAGHTECPHGEIILIGKYFNGDRLGQFETVFLTESFLSLLKDVEYPVAV